MTESKYPECQKMAKVVDQSGAIGEFLDWLLSGEADNDQSNRTVFLACYTNEDDDIIRWDYNIERLLAKFFEIDLQKVDTEKRAMIEALRKEPNAKETTTGD